MDKDRRESLRPSVAVLAAVLVGAIGLFVGMPPGTAVFAGAMSGFLVYVLVAVPSRYRRFGLGQRDQAVDHSQGQFGKTYPEEPADRNEDRKRRTTPPAAGPTRPQ
jgi:hypothetical protein